MKTKTKTPSVVSTSPAAGVSGFTLGLDLGDRAHHVCVLDTSGQIVRDDPERFSRGRDVGAYLGLCPRRDQSGGTDKQLRISKCGDGMMRRLLVSAAHYILGPFGPACALREYGQRLAGTGSAREKKRAVVAVARKLAVLLLSLWKHDADYEPRATTPVLVMTPA